MGEYKEVIKRGRGRPKGSKGKPKEIKETSLEIKRIKKEIKDLRAEKLSLPAGDIKRIELHRKIKEMKFLLMEKKEIKAEKIIETIQDNTEKEPIIAEILRIEAEQDIKPTFEVLGIDLHKYTVSQLKIHLKKLNEKIKNA
jgi:transposase